jgi:predicted permease
MFSFMDLKLGLRMLVKYPGLTVVGVLGMAVAIAIGAGTFTFFYAYMTPPLPLEDGDRVVAIENWDRAARQREDRALHDFVTWRETLTSIEDVGAYREITRNVFTENGAFERERIAEMTAAGFRLARVSPLAGRFLLDDDERIGAPPVIVIGYDAWQTRFDSDLNVIGKTVRLGDTIHTIVGVMPQGFAFPVYHRYWVALRTDPSAYERRQGPAINVFGRLAPGVTRATAQAELSTIGQRAGTAFPATHEHLRPRVAPYTSLWFGDDLVSWHLHLMQFLITMLLVVVCVNVASLVYARTATRFGELTIRSALGGSRPRIVTHLFVEALVLSTMAATLGLLIANRALMFVNAFLEDIGGAPFWMGAGLSLGSIAYTAVLVFLGAAIVGAVPALKATGRRLEPGLRQFGSASGLRLGKTWTTLIVAQVALVVAVMPAAMTMGWQAIGYRAFDPSLAADEYLTARISMDEFAPRFADRATTLAAALQSEPGVVNVAFSSRLPGDEPTARIEAEGTAGAPVQVRFALVSPSFFSSFEVPVLAGRLFIAADLNAVPRRTVGATRVPTVSGKVQEIAVPDNGARGSGVRATAVIVNRSFADGVFGGGNVLGKRVKYAGAREADAWFEIVGVVADVPPSGSELSSANARMYHPVSIADIYPVSVIARVRGSTPAVLAPRLRAMAARIDPTMQLAAVVPLDEVYREGQQAVRWAAVTFGAVTLSVLFLSSAGVYALMSFTIAQHRREIGIRTALGANPRMLLAGIFSRAFLQLSAGVVVGLLLAAILFEVITDSDVTGRHGAVVMPAVAMIMVLVGLIAAVGPARRGLQIDPVESLRTE